MIQGLFTAIYNHDHMAALIILNTPEFQNIAKNPLTLEELASLLPDCEILEGISSESISPLHYAAMKNSNIAIILMQYYRLIDGNNEYALYSANENGKTVLHYASYYDKVDVISFMLEAFMLQTDAEINSIDSEGNTPLHIAAANNNISTVMFLLQNGSDITLQNHSGETARNIAAEYPECQDIVNILDAGSTFLTGNVYGGD